MNEVSAAYTRRCRHFLNPQAFEEVQGVRHVVYLEIYRFRRIMYESGPDEFTNMKLAVEAQR